MKILAGFLFAASAILAFGQNGFAGRTAPQAQVTPVLWHHHNGRKAHKAGKHHAHHATKHKAHAV
jgi:hypothetical protein